MMGATKAIAGQLGRDNSTVSRPSRVHPLGPAAVGEKGEQTAAHAGGEAKRISHCCIIQFQNPTGGTGCSNRPDDTGGVEAAGMKAAAGNGSKPSRNFIPDGDCGGDCVKGCICD